MNYEISKPMNKIAQKVWALLEKEGKVKFQADDTPDQQKAFEQLKANAGAIGLDVFNKGNYILYIVDFEEYEFALLK